jgi:ABC-type nitrate/sulfonate/bicarbonate transport system substrate-binding protein
MRHIFLSFCLILFLQACQDTRRTGHDKTTPIINVGIQNSPSNALVIIADAKRFFDTTKVRVVIKEFSAGKLALQTMLGVSDDIQVAVSAETPVVLSSLGGNIPIIIGGIVNARNECRMVVRKDKDLSTPEQYFSKKRKIATSIGGSPEWLTYNFFKRYKIDSQMVEIVAMAPENMPIAIAGKAIDGCSIFDPYARLAERQIAENGLTFLNENMKTVDTNREALVAMLAGLKKAESFISSNPEEARQIIASRTKLDEQIVLDTWPNYIFQLGIDEELPQLCQDLAGWAITSGKYPSNTVLPDFKKQIDVTMLNTIDSLTRK